MTTKLVLNRREGVVAAQDVHLNRSVYSKPLVYSVNEDLSTDKAIKFKEDIRLAPKIAIKTEVSSRYPKYPSSLNFDHTVVYAFNNIPKVDTILAVKIANIVDSSMTINHNIVYAQIAAPNISTEVSVSYPKYNNQLSFSHYYNTIILDNFSDSMMFQSIKFKETTSEPKN